MFLNKSVPFLVSDANLSNMCEKNTLLDAEIRPADLVVAFTPTDLITISLSLVTLVATVAGSYIGYKNYKNVQRKGEWSLTPNITLQNSE